jgi:Zn-finger nucleic acid-binding protein
MRHLVVCPQCSRQFEAGDRPPGSRFTCSCGATVEVTVAQPREAAVIRCTACGAPRDDNAETCRYCGSSFTLGARDLDTVCPGCMARVSARDRFCHFCGSPILVDQASASGLPLDCPACTEAKLESRRLGNERLAVAECRSCGGLWLDNTVFEIVATRARQGQLGELGLRPPSAASPPPKLAPGAHIYRDCPVCRTLMNRHNYGRSSGVILDVCQRDGLWFDLDELPRLLAWIRAGGEERARRRQQEEDREATRQLRVATSLAPLAGGDDGWRPTVHFDLLGDLAAGLGEGLRHLFQRR